MITALNLIKTYHSRAVVKWSVSYSLNDLINFVGAKIIKDIDKTLELADFVQESTFTDDVKDFADENQGRVPFSAETFSSRVAEMALDPPFWDIAKTTIYGGVKQTSKDIVSAVERVSESTKATARATGLVLDFLPLAVIGFAALYALKYYKDATN